MTRPHECFDESSFVVCNCVERSVALDQHSIPEQVVHAFMHEAAAYRKLQQV